MESKFYTMCWYPKNKHVGHELELYHCEVLDARNGYATCQLFYGEELNINRPMGIVNDVCLPDLEFPIINDGNVKVVINEKEYNDFHDVILSFGFKKATDIMIIAMA